MKNIILIIALCFTYITGGCVSMTQGNKQDDQKYISPLFKEVAELNKVNAEITYLKYRLWCEEKHAEEIKKKINKITGTDQFSPVQK